MDGLDRWAAFSVTMLVACTATLLLAEASRPTPEQTEPRPIPGRNFFADPELDDKVLLARRLLAHDNLEQTEMIANSLVEQFPFAGEPYMLRGDILMRRQQPVASMYEYKNAVELNPDFLDRKSDHFQGRKIRATVEEAMAVITAGLRQNPKDNQLRDDRRTLYYMKRKLAGGCG
jgi:hypothetical protein